MVSSSRSRSAALVAATVALLAAGCTGDSGPKAGTPSPASTGAAPAPACAPPETTAPLPEWARAGFSGDGSGTPYLLSRRGDILGVVFGHTLSAPPAPDRSNKILWVSRVPVAPGDTLRITAQLPGTAESVSRSVPGGPGPSIIDVPRAGCWHLTLTWSGTTDTIDLVYQSRGSGTPPPGTSG